MLISLPAVAKPLQPRDVPPEVFLDRSGMVELVTQNALFGGFIGVALTNSLFEDEVRRGSGAILGPLLGVGLPYLLKHRKPIHVAEAGLYNFAERLGVFNGFLIPQLWNEDNERVIMGVPGALGLMGLGAGVALFPRTNLSPGQVSMLSTGMLFGGATGALGMVIADISLETSQAFAATTLLFTNGGALATYLARDLFDINRSRVLLLDLGGYFGAALGVGFAYLLGGSNVSDSPQLIAASALVGIYTGLGTTYYLTKDMDDYKRAAGNDNNHEQSGISLDSPAPALIASVDPETGKQTVGWGLNLLNGRW